ncbi:MAG: 50S ribosomal protein L5 [Candidatus Methanofastidiosia archaeon]
MNVMRIPRIEKVVVNIGVGESGEKLQKAEKLLLSLCNQKPLKRKAKKTNRDFKIRKGEPIGLKVTLRGKRAKEMLSKALSALEKPLKEKNFDEYGNFAFGISEHIDLPGVSYDPKIGIFGMDVCVSLERVGFRIKRRKIKKRKIHKRDYVSKEEAIEFVKREFEVSIR